MTGVSAADPFEGTKWYPAGTDFEDGGWPLLTFAKLRAMNLSRGRRWHPGFPETRDGWTGGDWSNASLGELGELVEVLGKLMQIGNTVKKVRRKEESLSGAVDPDFDTLKQHLANEIADVVIYLDLLAAFYGLDLASAVKDKFNFISEREGFPQRL